MIYTGKRVGMLMKSKSTRLLPKVVIATALGLAFSPCSIAADKAKVPPHGELGITSYVAWPNYTYTPDYSLSNWNAARLHAMSRSGTKVVIER